MSEMKWWTLAKKEYFSLMKSPMGWSLLALFSLLGGLFFMNLMVTWVDNMQALPAEYTTQISFLDEVVLKLFAHLNFLFLFFIPPLTMGLFVDERKWGTLDLLLTTPLTRVELILGKYLGVLGFGLNLILITLIYPVILMDAGLPDWQSLAMCYFALFLNCALYLALGMLASLLADGVVVAALLAFSFIMMTWMFTWLAQTTSHFLLSEWFRYLSLTAHFEQLLRGVLSLSDLMYYVTLTGFALWLSYTSLCFEQED